MKRKLWIAPPLILTATILAVVFLRLPQSPPRLSAGDITDVRQEIAQELEPLRSDVRAASATLSSIRTAASSVLRINTPRPPLNAANQNVIRQIQQADARRAEEIRGIERIAADFSLRLTDLQQRLTSLEARLNVGFDSLAQKLGKPETKSHLELIVVLVGLVSSFSTMIMAWRKDAREARAEVRVTEEGPNKAPEPTPGAVTPRATEGDLK
jgi:hypothetical protein